MDKYAIAIIDEGKRRGISARGIQIALSTALVETTSILMYANSKVPESLKLPHDRVGSDGMSVGLFQQQIRKGVSGKWWWGDCATCMDPALSAGLFYERLAKLDYDDPDVSPGWFAQSVQQSAFPDRYDERWPEAVGLYKRLTMKDDSMGDPVWLVDALRAEGVSTVEYGDWRNIGHGDFGPITHVMVHHTGGNSSANAIQNHPQLGLCSQIFLNRAGVAYVVGAGIAYHAGVGNWPGMPTNNGNQVSIGIEAENNGSEGWGAPQYWAYVKVVAAILRRLGLRADRCVAHKEYAAVQGKWDPGGMDMPKFRSDVQAQLDGAAQPVVNMIDKAAGDCPWLGSRVTKGEIKVGLDDKGRFAQFANGYIYWHPSTGAIAVPMSIFETWSGLGWESGPLGYPVRGHSILGAVGDVQAFQGGVVYRKYNAPGFFVTGLIGKRWAAEGYEKGTKGWPKSNEYDYDGGRRQDFDMGSFAWRADGVVSL